MSSLLLSIDLYLHIMTRNGFCGYFNLHEIILGWDDDTLALTIGSSGGTCGCCWWGKGELIRQPSQSQMGGCVVKIPLVSNNFMLFPQCRIDLFQSLAVSRPETYWNSLGVIQASWNQMQGPLDPWHKRDKYIKAVLLPHSISKTTSSSLTWK